MTDQPGNIRYHRLLWQFIVWTVLLFLAMGIARFLVTTLLSRWRALVSAVNQSKIHPTPPHSAEH